VSAMHEPIIGVSGHSPEGVQCDKICQMVVSSRCVELRLRMPTMRIQFMFLQQAAAGRRKIAEAEQEQLAGPVGSGMLVSMTKAP